MFLNTDKRIVMTLDAGGTNFVFSAVQGQNEIVKQVVLPSESDKLEACLGNIIKGFEGIQKQLTEPAVAISFAFPGPADYVNGIIGDLGNLPAFRGGVALGPMLQEHFQLPVFINNDGDLFAYGEAVAGLLPEVNARLKQAGSPKQYQNLIGVTLGTGFGGGLVRNNQLIIGDNGAAGEVWLLRNSIHPQAFAEENISARAVLREYLNVAGSSEAPVNNAFEVYQVATGQRQGNAEAARHAFDLLGTALGQALADVVTLFDGLVVIGGGVTNAWPLFFPKMLEQLNGHYLSLGQQAVNRLELSAFSLEDAAAFDAFIAGGHTTVKVPFSDRWVKYDPVKRTGVGVSRLGTSKAVALGAYAYALHAIDAGVLIQ